MSPILQIHPDNPQDRLVRQAVQAVARGDLIVYPTDSGYALGCGMGEKPATERIRRLRKLDDRHHFTLVCRDLSDISVYAKVDNIQYRQIKASTPGPYTFILDATSEVPRRLLHPKRRKIGIRIPDNRVAQALLAELGVPLMSSTLLLPGDEFPLTDPWEIQEVIGQQVDLIVDGGFCGMEPTTVVDLSTSDGPQIIRVGAGDPSPFE